MTKEMFIPWPKRSSTRGLLTSPKGTPGFRLQRDEPSPLDGATVLQGT